MKNTKMVLRRLGMGMLLSSGLFLAACGGATEGSEPASESTEGTNTAANSEATASSEPVNITFWHAMNGPHQEAITSLVEEFNESQEQYVVEEQNQGDYSTLQQSIMASGRSGDLPTLSQVQYTAVPDYIDSNLIVSLDDLVKGENGFSQAEVDDIYPGFIESSKVDGSFYSMPFSKSTRVMFYNQDILDEVGMEIPTTWSEVEELGEALEGTGVYAMGFENAIEMEYETMARQNGADFIAADTLETDIASEESVEALNIITNLIDNGYARTAGEDQYFSNPFGRGESALYIGSSAGVAHVAPVAEGISWGTTEIPTLNDTQLTQFAGNDLVIFGSASPEEQAGAFALMKFLLEPENTAEWSMASGYVPIRRSALDVPEYQAFLEENPAYEAANKELEYGYSAPAFVGYNEYRNTLLETLDGILVNGTPVEEALTDLDAKTKEIIESNN